MRSQMAAAAVREPMRSADPAILEAAVLPGPAGPGKDKKPKKPKPTGKKRLVKPLGGLLVALLAFHVVSGKVMKPHYAPGHPAPAGAIVELVNAAGTGTVTTNLSDGHLAQLAVSMQMTTVASSKVEAKEEDALMGDTIRIVGDHTYDELLSPPGRAALRAALLSDYQHILGPVDGSPQVVKVYFTSFVLQ